MTLRVADLELRPATLDDAAFASDIYTELEPEAPEDPVLFRHWWEEEQIDRVVDRSVAMRDRRAVGIAYWSHAQWEKKADRLARVGVELLLAARTTARLDALFAAMEDRARADGAGGFTAWARERDEIRRAVLAGRGYREERRQRFWELDLLETRERLERMTEESRERMKREGVRILTLAEDHDPERYRKIWRMSEEASQDIPRTGSYVEQSFEQFQHWLRSPGLREDRQWIARLGDDIVGISQLSYPPVRGVVVTDWTGTARSVRGRGVARAVKCETVMQAIALGVDRVRTDNDGANAPILHINETMGYQRLPDQVMYLRSVTPTG